MLASRTRSPKDPTVGLRRAAENRMKLFNGCITQLPCKTCMSSSNGPRVSYIFLQPQAELDRTVSCA